ncbi:MULTISPECIES: hypothetical protein [unclassified Streptomyces]|uniref:hypothetical protein n=1 Tax=unclassified Streptomyces TaxID=2593676 RepID=UPI0006B016E4|nr:MULTISPECIES: hypothetical protein [unclassified Streptomyces]KOX33691.1 hypothetical protein ADL06_08915 [Streptomyces sp. NRRL F-6491]KOX51265.1 hypothetical protein ADL08_04780 [Streptomyces sp. NRRL F-6492]
MFEHTGWTSGADRNTDRATHGPGRAPRLPDLAAVDLRTLRVLDDPALVAEVDRVLGRASELGESWFSDEGAE